MSKRIAFLYQQARKIKYRVLSGWKSKITGRARCNQPVLVLGPGRIQYGTNVQLGYFPSPLFYNTYIHLETRHMESLIKIGNNTKINNNFIAISNRAGIEIGENCVIGYSVEILDSDFHGFYGKEKGESHLISKKVIIWNNVFIGSNVKILKGSRIGDNSIIGINPVVRGKVSDNVVYAGNPGQIIIHL